MSIVARRFRQELAVHLPRLLRRHVPVRRVEALYASSCPLTRRDREDVVHSQQWSEDGDGGHGHQLPRVGRSLREHDVRHRVRCGEVETVAQRRYFNDVAVALFLRVVPDCVRRDRRLAPAPAERTVGQDDRNEWLVHDDLCERVLLL